MRGDPRVIEYLNRGLRHELTAINQYWLHYRLLDKMHDEEAHIDFLETQLDLVAKLGLELYSQHHIGEPDES
jgi:bacterioferritin (cytochrome b1)